MRRGVRSFRTRDGQHAIAQVRSDAFAVNRQRQLKGAAERSVAALDAMILLAGGRTLAACARHREPTVVKLDIDLAAGQPWHFSGDDVCVGGLVEINGRSPACGAGREAVQALLNREQVADRIPPGKGHLSTVLASHRSTARLCYDRSVLPFITMATIPATRLRKGMLIKIDNDLFRALDVMHVTPGNLRGFVRVKMRNIRSGVLADNRFRSEDVVERAVLDEREMQYLYKDGDDYYFMDTGTYDQIHISSEALGDSVNYLKGEMTIQVEFYGTEPVGIELPQSVDLKVTDTAPGIKGATASNQIKPATLETGVVVNVPPFINTGDVVRVNTETGEYLSRA